MTDTVTNVPEPPYSEPVTAAYETAPADVSGAVVHPPAPDPATPAR